MDCKIQKQDGAHGDGAVRSMKCSASGPRYCAVCGEWPAMETPLGLRCHLCECRDYAAAHPVPLPENREMLRDLASIGVTGAAEKLSWMPNAPSSATPPSKTTN